MLTVAWKYDSAFTPEQSGSKSRKSNEESEENHCFETFNHSNMPQMSILHMI
jgi:hypothetical protein